MINTDVDGRASARRATSAFREPRKLGLLDMLVAEGAKRGRTFTPDPQPETGGFYRSDHFPFAKVGVPGDFVQIGQ